MQIHTLGFSGYLNYLTIDYKLLTLFPTRRLRNKKQKKKKTEFVFTFINTEIKIK